MSIYQTLMNEIKNMDTPGTYIQPIPVGLQVKLKYSEKGILSKVTYATLDGEVDIPFELVVKLEQAGVFIQRLQMYKVACTVFGVLISPATGFKFNKCAGSIPQAFYPNMIEFIKKCPDAVTFVALDLIPDNATSNPATSAMSRLATTKFKVLNGIAVQSTMNIKSVQSHFDQLVKNLNPELPIVAGIYIHGVSAKILSANLKCCQVSKFDSMVDVNGYVHGKLKCDVGEGTTEIVVPYSQIVKYQISSSCFAILDESYNIVYVSQPKVFSRVASTSLTCPICGKKYTVNASAVNVSCADPHCASKLYPQVCRMLAKFGMPAMSGSEFTSYIKSGELKTLKDVFDIPKYAECEVSTTIGNLIEAITPISLLSGDMNSISKFVNQANSCTAVSYYIHNPSELSSDLNVSTKFAENFKAYWSDDFNVQTYDEFIELPDISVLVSDKKFDGDLIFRNKLICLTGEFKHGSYDEIISILQSYAGTPTVEFSPKVNFVLVGHLGKPDPYIIQRAQAYNVPIYAELEFFKAYKIDEDLAKFHLI